MVVGVGGTRGGGEAGGVSWAGDDERMRGGLARQAEAKQAGTLEMEAAVPLTPTPPHCDALLTPTPTTLQANRAKGRLAAEKAKIKSSQASFKPFHLVVTPIPTPGDCSILGILSIYGNN